MFGTQAILHQAILFARLTSNVYNENMSVIRSTKDHALVMFVRKFKRETYTNGRESTYLFNRLTQICILNQIPHIKFEQYFMYTLYNSS